jgi:hypothetical protein
MSCGWSGLELVPVVLRLPGMCLLALLALPVAPLQAQNAFQPIFGNGAGNRTHSYPATPPYRSTYGWSPYRRYQPDQGSEDLQPSERDGTVRTLCVRLCDGFYFPISSSAARSELARDADKCSALCSAEASLFYYSAAGGSVDTMVDLTGRAYTSMPNAFKYRKTLVKGCRCRPQPWSETELQRHRAYESEEVAANVRSPTEAERESTAASFDNRANGIVPIDRGTLEPFEPAAMAPSRTAGGEDGGVTIITSHRFAPRPQPVGQEAQVPPSWYGGSGRRGTSLYGDGARRR